MDREKLIEQATEFINSIDSEMYYHDEVMADFALSLFKWKKVESEADLPNERCLLALKRPHGRGFRVVIKEVPKAVAWSGVEIVAWMPLPDYTEGE